MAEPHTFSNFGAAAAALAPQRIVQPAWYAVQTRPRHEQAVATQLDREGIEVLLPMMLETRRWSDRRKVIQVPAFPNYVFVKILLNSNEQKVFVLRRIGVVGFVGPNRDACPIDPSQMESVRTLMSTKTNFAPHPYLAVGQRVRIRSGALKGLEGILLRVADDDHLVLSVDLINKSVVVRIKGYEVEVV